MARVAGANMATRIQQFPHSLPGAPGPHTTSYLQLTDTPGSFVAEAIPAVNAGGTAMAFSPDFRIAGPELRAVNAAGPAILNVLSSATVPSLCPTRGDLTKGIGSGSGNSLALISGGTQCLRLAGVGSGVNSYTFSSAVTGLPGRMIAQGPDTDIDTYLASKGAGVIGFHPGNGTRELFIDTDGLKAEIATGPAMLNISPVTTAVFRPNRVNNTGLGTNSTGSFAAMIHNGAEVFRFNSAGHLSLANINTVSGASLLNEIPSTINPTVLVNGADIDTGLGGVLNTSLNAIVNGSSKMQWGTSLTIFAQTMAAATSGGPSIRNNGATLIGPVFNPHSSLTSSGIGGDGSGGVSMVSGGNARIVVDSTGIGFFATTPAARPIGVAVTAAGIHAALVTLGLITA
jgi:hypothetical protein